MAQIFQLPFQFEFRRTPVKWIGTTLRIQPGWEVETDSRFQPHEPYVNCESLDGSEISGQLSFSEFPRSTRARLSLDAIRKRPTSQEANRGLIDLALPAFYYDGGASKEINSDAWEMRDEFLKLRPAIDEIHKFLNTWGIWGWSRGWWAVLGSMSNGRVLLPEWIAEQQEEVRSALKSGSQSWLAQFQRLPAASQTIEKYPFFKWQAKTIKEALIATVTVDLLKGTKFRVCAREDCSGYFAISSLHKRIFCTQYCGHVVSQRLKRAEAKKAKGQNPRLKG
jgi:hypothetical protein